MAADKLRILIADPDPDTGQYLQQYFRLFEYESEWVAQAEEVVDMVRQWQPSAVILSTGFSARQALWMCQTLLTESLTAHIPVLLLMEVNDRQLRLNALEIGVDAIIPKPLDIEELHLRTEAAIRLATVGRLAA
jgi:DNA-binding response OmpR family regulator